MAMLSTSFKSYEYSLNDDEQKLADNCGCDVLCVNAIIQRHKYGFMIVYRPPSSCFKYRSDLLEKTSMLNELIAKLTHPNSTNIIVGDFQFTQN